MQARAHPLDSLPVWAGEMAGKTGAHAWSAEGPEMIPATTVLQAPPGTPHTQHTTRSGPKFKNRETIIIYKGVNLPLELNSSNSREI